jgi:hypothetical protein
MILFILFVLQPLIQVPLMINVIAWTKSHIHARLRTFFFQLARTTTALFFLCKSCFPCAAICLLMFLMDVV